MLFVVPGCRVRKILVAHRYHSHSSRSGIKMIFERGIVIINKVLLINEKVFRLLLLLFPVDLANFYWFIFFFHPTIVIVLVLLLFFLISESIQ